MVDNNHMPTPNSKVTRFDAARPRGKARPDTWGNLHIPATFVTEGVFAYAKADGTTVLEYKPAEEIYSPAFMDSLRSATLCDTHPPVAVTPDNAGQYDCGHVKEQLERTDEGLAGEVVAKSKTLIGKVNGREATQVSIGLDCDIDPTPGVWIAPDGSVNPYSCIQRNMIANHVAIVKQARIPTANLRLDSAEMIVAPQKGKHMSDTQLMRIDVGDGTSVDIDPLAGHKIVTHINYLKAKGTEVFEASSKHEARADAAEATITELRAELKTHTDLDIDALVRERADTLASAGKLMKADSLGPLIAAGKTNDEIRRAACEACEVKVDGKDVIYITARFDALLETASDAPKNDQAASVANLVNAHPPEQQQSTRQRYDAAEKELSNAWKKKAV